jgi:hypothetical protein
MDAEQIWAEKPDEDVVEAGEAIWEFTEDGERIIRAELRRRGLPAPPAPVARCSTCGRAIHGGDPSDACGQCGQAFSEEILGKMDAAVAVAEDADDAEVEEEHERPAPVPEGWESEAEADLVYRSRFLHEVEMLCEHLEREDLPFTRAEERMGDRFHIPVAAAPATLPGAWYLVTVPAEHAARAAEIVDELPISKGGDEEAPWGPSSPDLH